MSTTLTRALMVETIKPLLEQPQQLSTGSVSCDGILRVLMHFTQHFGADYGRIMLSTGTESPSTLTCCVAGNPIAPIRDGFWIEERTIIQREGIVASSISTLPYFCNHLEGLPGATELMAAPLMHDEMVIGTVSLGFITQQAITRDTLNDFSSTCGALAHCLPTTVPFSLNTRYTVDLSILYAQLPWAVLLIDDTGRILCANRTCSQLLMRDTEHLNGKLIDQFLVAAEAGLPHASGEVAYLLRPDGSRRLAQVIRAALSLDDGHVITMLVLWDVSQEQQVFQERLKSAELEGISHTVATVNHEINNPLFGLMATVQLLKSELQPASPSIEKKFERIGECCERIQQIIDKLSRVMQPARRTYAANEGMLDLTRATDQHGIDSTHGK